MYDVMAVGNALVDHEYKVNDEQLIETSLKKGSMTLASLEEQTQLLNEFKAQHIEPSKQTGGGSAANAIYAFTCLGGRSFYGCRVGDDNAGQFYLNDLEEVGVTTSAEKSISKQGVTGSCVVAITPDGERTMQTYLGTSADIDVNNINFEALKNSEWLYFEGYLAMSETLRPDIQKLRQHAKDSNTKIAVSFADPAVVNFGKEGLIEMLGDGVDVIFCNVEEAKLFTNTDSIEQAAQALTKYSQLAVVTNGPDDTVILQRSKDGVLDSYVIPTPVVTKVIDTNGAGDNYSGTFLYALTKGYDIEQCALLAGRVASQIVQQFGPRLTSAEYQTILNKVLSA